jgi:hypothetical protein
MELSRAKTNTLLFDPIQVHSLFQDASHCIVALRLYVLD